MGPAASTPGEQPPQHAPLRRAAAERRAARRARQRRQRIAVLGATAAVALGVVAVVAWSSSRAPQAAPPVSVAGTSATNPAAAAPSTTTTRPPHPLLAPTPTDVPNIEVTDGLAPEIRRVDTTDRVIFITIDDGQIRDPAYLQRFEEMGLPFTSFVLQPLAEADPDFWKATVGFDGTLQTHTINHPNLREAGEATIRREVCEPADKFAELFGQRPTLFRAPYGNSNETVRRIAHECGYAAVLFWAGSTNGGKLTMQDESLHPGDIILMHYRDTLLIDLDDVVARALAEGFKIARLEDYLVPAGGDPDQGPSADAHPADPDPADPDTD